MHSALAYRLPPIIGVASSVEAHSSPSCPRPVLKGACNWMGLRDGGTLSDDELNQMLSPLVIRPRSREWVRYPDGSWRA